MEELKLMTKEKLAEIESEQEAFRRQLTPAGVETVIRIVEARLEKRLKRHIDFQKLKAHKGQVRVVSLGCGIRAEELSGLRTLMQEYVIENWVYVGIDTEPAIKEIKKNKNELFFVEDASNTEAVKRLVGEATTIIIRHPLFGIEREGVWMTGKHIECPFTKILKNTVPAIANENTQIFVTCYQAWEQDKAKELFQLSTAVQPAQERPHTRELNKTNMVPDEFILYYPSFRPEIELKKQKENRRCCGGLFNFFTSIVNTFIEADQKEKEAAEERLKKRV